MKDFDLGINLSVLCTDGSTHDNVTLRIQNNCKVFKTADGTRLDVVRIEKGLIAASPQEYALICRHCNHKQEAMQ
jgi:hypothetical protein